jgi:hypothetical protein
MKEDWTEKLRQKLEGHRKSPPPGLWEGICEQMGLTPEPVQESHTIRRWYWAVAAAVLALVGFFIVYDSNDYESSQPQQANVVSPKPASEAIISKQSVSEAPSSGFSIIQHPTSLASSSSPLTSSEDEAEQALLSVEEEQPTEPEPNENVAIIEEKQEDQDERILMPERNYTSDFLDKPSDKTKRSTFTVRPNKWSLGVNASGGLLAANTSQRMDRLYYQNSAMSLNEIGNIDSSTDKGDYSYNSVPLDKGYFNAYTYTLTEYRSEHHLPIRFGVSLNYQLTPRIALHSGISYTYLYSEFSIPLYERATYDQKLHYLGIPLGVSWRLWSTRYFQFYVSGGAMLEKCVSVDHNGSSANKKPWQWSVNAAAGAEYNLIPQLGFYLEPSLGYYFDDGTALDHYYKQHPLTPTIEFGLRLHLNR